MSVTQKRKCCHALYFKGRQILENSKNRQIANVARRVNSSHYNRIKFASTLPQQNPTKEDMSVTNDR